MAWTQLLNKESQIARFRNAYVQNRLASTYLFVGKPGIGKRKFAIALAQALLCEDPAGVPLSACGTCAACTQVDGMSHPDLIMISKPKDKAFIPLELFIGDKEHRRQEGLIHDIGLKPYRGGRKIAIIDDADFLNQEGANSLLKTLEEPPPMSVLILIGSSEQQQLPTILSRSQVIRFEPLTTEQVLLLLNRGEPLDTDVPVEQLATAAAGSMDWAFRLADSELFNFREYMLGHLASSDPGDHDFTKNFCSFIDSAGAEGAVKRDRLIFLADIAILFFRQCLLQLAGVGEFEKMDQIFTRAVDEKLQSWKNVSLQQAEQICVEGIERTLELQQQVWMNVSPANAVDAWVIDLGRIYRGKYLAC